MAKGRGRPRGPCRGESQEINRLALLLQEQLRRADMSVRDLREALARNGLPLNTGVPSHATLQRRLNGEGLANSRELIETIIRICTPEPEVESTIAAAKELIRRAAIHPTRIHVEGRLENEISSLRTDKSRLMLRLVRVQEELLAERNRTAQGQKRDDNQHFATSPSGEEDHILQQTLHEMQQERDAARTALLAAERRIQELVRASNQPPTPRIDTIGHAHTSGDVDHEIKRLEQEFRRLDPDGNRMARAIRRAFDLQLDGSHTGRFSWRQLHKVEKVSLSQRVVQEYRREFGLGEGVQLDVELRGIDLGFKFSISEGGWQVGQDEDACIFLLVAADDQSNRWSSGLLRIKPELLHPTRNRDGKARLNPEGRRGIRWLHRGASLPENVLTTLSEEDLTAIFAPLSSQKRIDELLRRAQRRKISSAVVATVALQDDASRRVRAARPHLSEEGILVLGGMSLDRVIAQRLILPVPNRGEWVSIQVAPLERPDESVPFFEAGGRRWTVARPGDAATAAPRIRPG